MILLMMALACAPKVVDLGPIPEVGEAGEFTPLVPEVTTLESGARLWLIEDTELPVAIVRVMLPGGSASDGPAWGRAEVVAQMLTQSAGERSAVRSNIFCG